MVARKRSDESFRHEILFQIRHRLALPHTLDGLGTESAVHVTDADHETDIEAVVDTDEVKTLDNVTDFYNSVFAFHNYILTESMQNAIEKTRIKSITYECGLNDHFRVRKRNARSRP